ncbi:FMN-binding protein [Bifidobacterium samirii]|uniref:FMN-binding protein n=1 Tax=Bifidobacterium samirii TaxID=2306974 RepID=A0A430FWH5_9BIFI|nr:FMN-binding protein [Bifidobacterium samirii]RSX58454.1 FMN-binding protein [Bifidobacterium samirii]
MTDGNAMTKTVAMAAAGLVVAGAMLSGCGEPTATPMDDEFAGNSGETVQSQQAQGESGSDGSGSGSGSGSDAAADGSDASQSSGAGARDDGTTSDKTDTGDYADGTYAINGQYGPVGEDTIDVRVTVKDQLVERVEIVGHPFTSISKRHQTAFAEAINDVVDGRPLKDLSVDVVAGASWTTDAFNEALKVARQEASIR